MKKNFFGEKINSLDFEVTESISKSLDTIKFGVVDIKKDQIILSTTSYYGFNYAEKILKIDNVIVIIDNRENSWEMGDINIYSRILIADALLTIIDEQ